VPPPPDDLLPITQAATEFEVARSTLFKAIKTGRLSSYRSFGDKRTFVSRRQVVRLLQPKRVT
jgi:hypothetical protein